MDQGSDFPSLFDASWRSRLERSNRKPWCESRRVHPARHGRLDASLPRLHALHHAAAQTPQAPRADSLSPHARPLRVFLRLPSFPDLSWAGPVLRSKSHLEGRRQAPLRHRRVHGFCASDSAGSHVNCGMDSPSRRAPLANTPSSDLYQRNLWCDSLLLAGEIRSLAPTYLRRNRRGPTALAPGRLVYPPRPHHLTRPKDAARIRERLVRKTYES